jgi:TolB-like protein
MNRYRLRTWILVTLLAAAGCAGSRGKRYQDPQMDFGAIRTVAVMPFTNLSRDNLAAERVRETFASELLASGAVYVLPYGEVVRGVGRVGVGAPQTPSVEEVVKLGTALKAEGVITGTVKEYGEVRSGTATANAISVSVQLFETATGKVVWAAETTRGGVSFKDRMLGGGGDPLNDVTEAAVDDLLKKLLK